ncbi:MAG: hypothetical protein JWP97_3735 [Labilithrix sp.]|nr:hypothetical protein [Labilithrix sp.]
MKQRAVDVLLLAVGLACLFAVPHRIGGDGAARYETLERLWTTGVLASARYSVVMPLLASPLYLLGRAIGHAQEVTALFNPLLFVCTLAVIARDMREDLAPAARRTMLLLLVYASMFANHVQSFYGEVFTALTIVVGVLWLSRGRTAAGWALIVLGAVNTPGVLLGVVGIAVRDAQRTRRWTSLVGPVLVVVLSRLEAFVVRGSLLATGYEADAGFRTALPYSGKPGFSYPFFLGVLAIVLSFGKGLVFFAPGLFAPPRAGAGERLRWVQRTLVVFTAGLVVAYAKWWAWYGGTFWGPRFFLIASVPACLALGTWLAKGDAPAGIARRLVLVAAVLLSFWVGVNGLVFDQAGLGICTANDYALEAYCHFVPEMSVLWHPFVDFASAVPPPTRPLAIGICLWWALAAGWVLRHVLVALARDLARSRVHGQET